jgi:hypothetical protein
MMNGKLIRAVLFAAPVAILSTLLWHTAWIAVNGSIIDVLRDSDGAAFKAILLNATGLSVCWTEPGNTQRCSTMPFNQFLPLKIWCVAALVVFGTQSLIWIVRKGNSKY